MPIFSAAAAYLSTFFAGVSFSTVASFAARTLLTIGVAKLLSNRQDNSGVTGAQDNNARIQLNPSTSNKLPVIYGNAFVEGAIIDAKISTDQQTMWYVIALCELGAPDTQWRFNSIYWNNNELTFDNTDHTSVINWMNNAEPPQLNQKVNGKIHIYLYAGNSSSPYNTSLSAIDVLNDPEIPVDQRWASTNYMDNTIFMIVKMKFDRDAATTTVGSFKAQLLNNYYQPGTAIYDYLTNSVYGCAIPSENVDIDSLIELNSYSDEYISFTSDALIDSATKESPCLIGTDVPHGLTNESKIVISGVTGMTNLNGNTYYVLTFPGYPTYFALYADEALTIPVDSTLWPTYVSGGTFTGQQPRYRLNGPVVTGSNCLSNLQQMVDSCDAWLQYSEMNGQWKVVINKPFTGAETDLFLVDDSNLVTGIEVNPIDLNNTYNSLEIQYPNFNIKDQYDFPLIILADYYPNLISPNEAENKLIIQLPQVNNSVQSTYIGIRRLLQSREDLIVNFSLDYSGIQIEAGDIIRVKFAPYGWNDPIEFPNGKLFRVTQVQETKDQQGFLGVSISAFEYNGTVYYDQPLLNYVPTDNTGLSDPNIISAPGTPVNTDLNISENTIAGFTVTSTVPLQGVVIYMDFNYGTSSDIATHRLYRTTSKGNGTPYIPGETVSITVNDLPAGSYYWSITARNNSSGSSGAASIVKVWAGSNVTTYAATTKTGASSVGTTVTVPSTVGIRVGDSVVVTSGTGDTGSNNTVAQILGLATLLLAKPITTALSDAVVKFFGGGVDGENIADGAVTTAKLGPNMPGYNYLGRYSIWVSSGMVLPVDVETLPAGNVPIFINGTSVTGSDLWPWGNGTSSTANGYAADSTGPYEPRDAALIGDWDPGDSNFYKLFVQDFSENPFTTSERLLETINISVVSDTPNTIFQIVSCPDFGPSSSNKTPQTQYLMTYHCPEANVPYSFTSWVQGTATGDIIAVGSIIRNVTGGSVLTVVACEWSYQQVAK